MKLDFEFYNPTKIYFGKSDIDNLKGELESYGKNIFFGGEGVFLTKVTGPGKVYLQSMPIVNVAGAISSYITLPSSDSEIKINLSE